ncbi:hypothetical protein CMU05_18620, partial [Elizabethkingia anophelis]|nr:hypothetical protein [Elizabethkingia anophelis]
CVISQRYPKLKAIHNRMGHIDKDGFCCVISQRYPKLKAIHNLLKTEHIPTLVVLYHKDIQN